MRVPRVVVPPAPFVTVAQAKRLLRVEHNEHDADIEQCVAAATDWLDGPAGVLGRALAPQTLELRGAAWCDFTALPCPPLIELVSLQHRDLSGELQTVDPALYGLAAGGVGLAPGGTWPLYDYGLEAIILRYRAGYIEDPDTPGALGVPLPLRRAVLLAAKVLYEGGALAEPGGTIASLISPFHIRRL